MASETSSLGGFSKRSLAKSNASRAKPIVVKYLDWFCDCMATAFQNMQVKSRYDVIAVARTGCHETGDNFSGASKVGIAQASLLLRVQLDLVRDGAVICRSVRIAPRLGI